VTKWEEFFEEKVKEISQGEFILDVGGGLRLGKGMERYKDLFEGKKYVVLDKEASFKPDIVGDIHDIPLKDRSVDAVICKAVLEHIEEPSIAVAELHRILKPGGKALFYVPFLYPYHAERGVYKDYYRFSKDAVEYLFRNFSKLEYVPVRGFVETWFHFLPWKLNRILTPLGRFIDNILNRGQNQTSGFNIFVVK